MDFTLSSEDISTIENDPILKQAFGIENTSQTSQVNESPTGLTNVVEDISPIENNTLYPVPELSKENQSIIENDPILKQAFNVQSIEEDPIIQNAFNIANQAEEQEDITFTNLVNKGLGAVGFEILHAPQNIRAMSSALSERFQPGFIFGKSNPDEVYMADVYDPQIGNSFYEQTTYNTTKVIGEFLYTLATTGIGAGAGSVVPGVGTAVGGVIGRTAGVGTISAAIFNQTLREGYDKYLLSGLDKSEAFEKATHDAIVESAIEFGSEWLIGKLSKLKELGASAGKLTKYLTGMVTRGEVKATKNGLELTADGINNFKNLIKTLVKGGAVEGGEEIAQQSWEVGRHRNEGQSWGEALYENAGEILKSGAIGAVSGGLSVGAGIGIGKGIEVATNKITEKNKNISKEFEDSTKAVNKMIEEENTDLEQSNEIPNQYDPKPIKDIYGDNVSGNTEIDAQGETVLTPKEEKTLTESNSDYESSIEWGYGEEIDSDQVNEYEEASKNTWGLTEGSIKATTEADESVDAEDEIQSDENLPSYNYTQEQRKQLANTRKELSDEHDFGNNDYENNIEGSVSDDGYSSLADHSLETDGLSKKDNVPTTPTTVKNYALIHNAETQNAFSKLGIEQSRQKKVSPKVMLQERFVLEKQQSELKANNKITNNNVSRYHLRYGIKNLVESIAVKFADKGEQVFNLYIKSELTDKENKNVTKQGRGLRGFVLPAFHEVIRVNGSTNFKTTVHEAFHHLVYQGHLKFTQANPNQGFSTNTGIRIKYPLVDVDLRNELRKEHKKLEKLAPYKYRLNEAAYAKMGHDIVEEYACNLAGAYVTDDYIPSPKVKEFIENTFETIGVKEQFDTARQLFVDYNVIKKTPDGALALSMNDFKAAQLLAKGKFDTKDLNAEQIKTQKKIIEISKKIPEGIVKAVWNETYQLEKDVKKIGQTRTLTLANQSLLSANKIEQAFLLGNGAYFTGKKLRVLNNVNGIKNVIRIKDECNKLGEGYEEKLKSLLLAKQTIGESSGNQYKLDFLMELSDYLEYKNWVKAWTDLKFISDNFLKSLYSGKHISNSELSTVVKKLNDEKVDNILKGKDKTGKGALVTVESAYTTADVERLNNMIDAINDHSGIFLRDYKSNLSFKLKMDDREFNKTTIKNKDKKRNLTGSFAEIPKYKSPLIKEITDDPIKALVQLDKDGSVDTGMSLIEALQELNSIYSDPKAKELLAIESDVRDLYSSLEKLMLTSDVSSRMRIQAAKSDTGAWYIPLLRFIDKDEEKAKEHKKGSSLKARSATGSEREVLDIFSSIENSIKSVARQVSTNQAIEYLLTLRMEPIFAKYIREIPTDSREVSTNMYHIVKSKIKEVKLALEYAKTSGRVTNRIGKLETYLEHLKLIEEDIQLGRAVKQDVMVEIFVGTPPMNGNVIQRIEVDGQVHYYLVDDVIKDFLYNQRKSLSHIINQHDWARKWLGGIVQLNSIIHALARASFTIFNPSFQTANVSRDIADVTLKSTPDSFAKGLLFPLKYIKNMSNILAYYFSLSKASNRREFNKLAALFGGEEQTQYTEGEFSINYMKYKVNKKGKIVRGGPFAFISTLTNALSKSDLPPRIIAIKQRAKEMGVNLELLDATVDDFISLNLTKGVLKNYITDGDIKNIFGDDKLKAWLATKDDEYFGYVPEEFEKSLVEHLLLNKYSTSELMKGVPTIEQYSELQELYSKASIDFSRGTLLSRTLGKFFLFANTRLQGGYQTFQYVNNNKKAATGAITSMATLALLAVISGLDDDDASDDDRLRGINLKVGEQRYRIPAQTIILIPYNMFRGLFKSIFDKEGMEDLKDDLINSINNETFAVANQLTGLSSLVLNAGSIFYTGHTLNFGDSEKYNKFSPYQIQKMGANVDRLIKKGDSVLAYSLSKWLVDNGLSYKYSTHEINRVIENLFGDAEQQIEALLGMKLILTDSDAKIKWLDWKLDLVDDFFNGATKQFMPNESAYSEEVDYIKNIAQTSLSLYDRYTNQIGAKKADRYTPDELTDEERKKYGVYYNKHYLANQYLENIKYLNNILYHIDLEKEGGQKAYNHLAIQIKHLAKDYKTILDNYNDEYGDRDYEIDTDPVYNYMEDIIDTDEANKKAPEKKSMISKAISALTNEENE